VGKIYLGVGEIIFFPFEKMNVNPITLNENIQKQNSSLIRRSGFPRWIYFFFYIFAIYLVIPVIDVPLLGLSLSAPIFFFISFYCFFKSSFSWFQSYRRWIMLALGIWLGIFIAATLNGLLSGGVNINGDGLLNVIRYGYWLLVFVITAYFANSRDVLQKTVKVLGWSILALALVRCGEVALYGNIGAFTGTHLMTQNSYGFLFSTFSPFLLFLMIQQRGWKQLLMVIPNVILWGAAAINASRGSWISIAVGVTLCLVLLLWSRPRQFVEMLVLVLLLAGIICAIYITLPDRFVSVIERFNTLQSLAEDKSYMIRQLMNQKSIKLFEESPIIGVGSTRYVLSEVSLDLPFMLKYGSQEYFNEKSSHNSYLDFLAENGLVGEVPYGILILVLLFHGLRWVPRYLKRGEYWALAIYLAFIQMSVHMWVISSLTNTMNWFIYGLVGAMIMMGPKYFGVKSKN
jgi:O-antigen ligase